MPLPIEDYALIGDLQTAALVGRDGSIDWLCLPRFDSDACFAALLGDERNGRWLIAPAGPVRRVTRRYSEGTLVLETEFETDDGSVRLIDFMPPRDRHLDLIRIVEGISGRVPMRMQLVIRFDYGRSVPWVRSIAGGTMAIAGPNALFLRTPVHHEGKDMTTVAEFSVAAGDSVPFVLNWYPSHDPEIGILTSQKALRDTKAWWHEWVARCSYEGEWPEATTRSLITLKAMIYEPTGGIVAAPTTSLPEQLGGVRNWDYRYCWLRDATFTLYSLMMSGYLSEARSWRDWLLRAIAGDPSQLQILYGPAGERRLPELELDWLPGYEGALPVRVGNAAVDQFQLDVYGEVADSLYLAQRMGIEADPESWEITKTLTDHLESAWKRPDEGIWEVRGARRHFTHSKVMAWVAADRVVRGAEEHGFDGDVDRWRRLRREIHEEVCERGYDRDRGIFTQHYGSRDLDASLLMMSLVGFLPASDERVVRTVEAIRSELSVDGFLLRYTGESQQEVDGLPPGEGAFLPCTFWLADNLALQGRREEARAIFEGLLSVRNDVGLLAEEYDVRARRLVGNFPQAFAHVSLVNSALNLSGVTGPSQHRSSRDGRADESAS
jgi:GH15 family glucan-1,4-alpha-glucosidase